MDIGMLKSTKQIILLLLFIFLLFSCKTTKNDNFVCPTFVPYIRNGKNLENKDFFLLYAAASWCPDCQQRSLEIKKQFQDLEKKYENVAVIFIGSKKDTKNDEILDYLQTYDFDLPYISFDDREKSGLQNYLDINELWIPGNALIDKYGNVLCDSGTQDPKDWDFQKAFQYLEKINSI